MIGAWSDRKWEEQVHEPYWLWRNGSQQTHYYTFLTQCEHFLPFIGSAARIWATHAWSCARGCGRYGQGNYMSLHVPSSLVLLPTDGNDTQ
jgi:hypothetical protein